MLKWFDITQRKLLLYSLVCWSELRDGQIFNFLRSDYQHWTLRFFIANKKKTCKHLFPFQGNVPECQKNKMTPLTLLQVGKVPGEGYLFCLCVSRYKHFVVWRDGNSTESGVRPRTLAWKSRFVWLICLACNEWLAFWRANPFLLTAFLQHF